MEAYVTFAEQLSSAARRSWPALALVAYVTYFDFRLKGDAAASLLLAVVGAAPLLLRTAVGPHVRTAVGGIAGIIPRPYRGLLVAGVPVALLYLTRWKGTQPTGAAMLSVALPLGVGALIAANRERLDAALGPFYRARNAILPKVVRVPSAIALPVVFSFAIAHGNLGDLSAFFGGTTSTAMIPGARTGALLLTVALSAACAFLLLNDPPAAGDGD